MWKAVFATIGVIGSVLGIIAFFQTCVNPPATADDLEALRTELRRTLVHLSDRLEFAGVSEVYDLGYGVYAHRDAKITLDTGGLPDSIHVDWSGLEVTRNNEGKYFLLIREMVLINAGPVRRMDLGDLTIGFAPDRPVLVMGTSERRQKPIMGFGFLDWSMWVEVLDETESGVDFLVGIRSGGSPAPVSFRRRLSR